MAKKSLKGSILEESIDLVPYILKFPNKKMWIDYDEEADVLYISFKRPQKATNTELVKKDGVLLRYKNKDLVGVTILDASKR